MPRLLGVPGGLLSAAADRWRHARRLLCVRLDSLGDVLMTAPAIRALVADRPDRDVTLWTSTAGAQVAPLVREVADVLVYEAPWMKATPAGADVDRYYAMVDRLRRGAFDGAIVFTVYSQSPLPAALACLEAGIPLRLAHCRENPYQLLTDWVREPEPDRVLRHEVRRQLDLVATIGAHAACEELAVTPPERRRRAMRDRLRMLGVATPFVALHPGASAPSRRYPAEGFVAAGRALAARGHRLVVVGSGDEAPLAQAIATDVGAAATSIAGTTSVADLAAVLALARVCIANNSGPMHLAAAVGTPVVALYALTNPQHTPWSVPARVLSHDVPCRHCYRSVCPEGHHACLRGVAPEAIVAAVEALWDARPRRTPPPRARAAAAAVGAHG